MAFAPCRAHMQLELEAATRELEASRTAHADLAARHEAVSARYEELRRQCKEVGALQGGWRVGKQGRVESLSWGGKGRAVASCSPASTYGAPHAMWQQVRASTCVHPFVA